MIEITTTVLCRETGLSKALLCQWETRYSFPNPRRVNDGNGSKFYTSDDVEKIIVMKELKLNGYPLSYTAPRSLYELKKILKECKK